MAEFWLPERDGVIILDREEKRGKWEWGRDVGLQREVWKRRTSKSAIS